MADKPPAVLHRVWRTGEHWGKTVVAMGGDEYRHPDDELIGVMFSPAVAAHIAALHNAWLERRERE